MLETEIKNLTAAIKLLTDALDKNHPAAQPEAPAPAAEPAPVFKPTLYAAATITNIDRPSADLEALQTRCLELTRIDRANSPKIKAIIASYGAAVLKDVPADKLGELSVKLEELA